MTRTVDGAILTAMAAATFSPLVMVEMAFDSGDLNLWNGLGDKTINSVDYVGAGELLSLSEAQETSEVASRGMTIALTAVPSDLIALALAEPFQGRKCTVRIGFAGSDATAIIFKGFMDQMNVNEGSGHSSISISVENELSRLDRIAHRLYTEASHKSRYPGDKAFNFVSRLGRRDLNWGKGR